MSCAANTENVPNRFQQESLNLVNSLLPLSSSGFYLVGPDLRHSGIVLREIDPSTERAYAASYREHDPLRPTLFARTDVRVACLDEEIPEADLLQSVYYREFMLPLEHRHVADMFFRSGTDIIAVLTMLRNSALGPFTATELQLLRRLQPFLEYTLNREYQPRRYRERESLGETYGLTERELDVVEFIVAGASNKVIARELQLSLATVKTHIQHIFQKAGVSSRTSLTALLLGELSR